MKFLKNIIRGCLCVLMASTVLTSCDYLDVVPPEQPNLSDATGTYMHALGFLYSCYKGIEVTEVPWTKYLHEEVASTDEIVLPYVWSTDGLWDNYACNTVNATPSNHNWIWGDTYRFIGQCLLFLQELEKIDPSLVPEKTLNEWEAEAKFLIAYYHFLLVRNYGPVILVKEEPSLTTPADQYAARSPYDECVDYVCQMFDEAAAELPATRINENYGLATSVAAKALKARMLLYAASPLFNGNSEFYSNFVNKDGTALMPQAYSAEKWQKAKVAYEEAIRAAEGAGHSLYTSTDYMLDGYDNAEPADPVQHRLRYTIIEPANTEVIWADCRSEGAYSVQNKSLPFCNGSAYNGVSPTLAMLKRFYTKNGLPVDQDPEFPKGNSIYEVTALGEENATIGDPEAKTIRFNLNREPRFYSWVAFQGGFYEIMSASDGNGAYQNDESYNKYSDSGRGKLVCDFVIGGNTSRQPAGSSLRTNNYSPTGYLNKKGVVPGYNVRTSLYNPPFYPWPVIRLAELYLGYAEACVECNDLNTAKTYLDKVRTRAGIPTVETSWNGIATLDQAKLREIVRQERTIEFYLENQTFWDLRRWKQAAEYFGVKAKGMNIAGKTIDEFAQETEVSFERKFESPTQYLMPVPLTDVNRNMNLVQNPGY